MIEAMRSKAASWVVKILALFLILSFAIWGVGDMIRGVQPYSEAASVGETEIARTELSEQFSRVVRTMQERVGPAFTNEQAVRLGLLDQTLNQMVDARLLSLEARRLGLAAGEELVRQTIYRNPEFRGPGDRFDKTAFRQALSRRGMSEQVFVATLQGDIMRNQIAGALTAGTTPPKPLADTLYLYRNEKRVADVVLVPAGKAADVPAPTEAELVEFHKNNAGPFTAPEYRRVTVLYLNPDVAAKEITPSAERLKEEFAYRKETLSVPERRTISQALFQDEAKAQQLVELAAAGRPFADAVKEVTGSNPVSLGTLAKADLPKEVGEAAFALASGAVGAPVQTTLGWHVLHVSEIIPGKTPKFEDVRDKIARDIAREQAIDNLVKLTNQIDDTLAGGGSLAEAGTAVGTRPVTVAAIAADGTDPDGKKVTGVPPGAEFLRTAFGLSAGETSSVIETDNGGYFVAHVDAITPPALRPLAKIRDKVAEAWKQSKLDSAAEEKAAHLQARARATTLEDAAREAGYQVVISKPFSRFIREPDSVVSDSLATALFKAKVGDVVTAPAEKGMAVARLAKTIEAKPGTNEAESNSLTDELRNAIANDMLAQLLAALRQRYPVKVNRAAIDIVAGGSSAY